MFGPTSRIPGPPVAGNDVVELHALSDDGLVCVSVGRFAQTLWSLTQAADAGISSLHVPGLRLSHYVKVLPDDYGVLIETDREPHGGDHPGRQDRYRLRSKVDLVKVIRASDVVPGRRTTARSLEGAVMRRPDPTLLAAEQRRLVVKAIDLLVDRLGPDLARFHPALCRRQLPVWPGASPARLLQQQGGAFAPLLRSGGALIVASLTPFPMACRRAFVVWTARRVATATPPTGGRLLAHTLCVQADAMLRRGIAPDVAAAELAAFEAAVRAEFWRLLVTTGGVA